MENYDVSFLTPHPIIQSDIEVVWQMNNGQKELCGPFETWPEWAKRDVQLLANYRRCLESRRDA
jgi:hypothetical protein